MYSWHVDDENIKYFMVPISDEAEIFFIHVVFSYAGVNILSRDLLGPSFQQKVKFLKSVHKQKSFKSVLHVVNFSPEP